MAQHLFSQHMSDVRFFFVVNKPCVPLSKWDWLGARRVHSRPLRLLWSTKPELSDQRSSTAIRLESPKESTSWCTWPDFWCHLDPETCFGIVMCHVMPLAAMMCHSLLIAATLRSWWSWEIQRPAWYSGWMSFKAFTAFTRTTFAEGNIWSATQVIKDFWRTIVNKTNHKRRSRRGKVGVGVGAWVEVGVGVAVAVSSNILWLDMLD